MILNYPIVVKLLVSCVRYYQDKEPVHFSQVLVPGVGKTHLSSNLILASRLALRFRAGSLKTSLLTTVLSRGMSTEYLSTGKNTARHLVRQLRQFPITTQTQVDKTSPTLNIPRIKNENQTKPPIKFTKYRQN